MPYFVKIEKTSEAIEQEFQNFLFMVSCAILDFADQQNVKGCGDFTTKRF